MLSGQSSQRARAECPPATPPPPGTGRDANCPCGLQPAPSEHGGRVLSASGQGRCGRSLHTCLGGDRLGQPARARAARHGYLHDIHRPARARLCRGDWSRRRRCARGPSPRRWTLGRRRPSSARARARCSTSAARGGRLRGPSSPTTLSICAALALLTPLVNPGSLYRGGKGTFKSSLCATAGGTGGLKCLLNDFRRPARAPRPSSWSPGLAAARSTARMRRRIRGAYPRASRRRAPPSSPQTQPTRDGRWDLPTTERLPLVFCGTVESTPRSRNRRHGAGSLLPAAASAVLCGAPVRI